MDKRFEDILKEGLERSLRDKGINDFNTATNIQRGKALTDFYAKEIGQYLYKIYEEDIDDSLCDGKGDLGVDFVYKKDNEWLIFQSKYKGRNSCVTLDEISGFFNIHSRITDQDYFEKHANRFLKDLLIDFKSNDTIQFIFITNDNISRSIEDEFNRLKREHEAKNENIFFELKGLTDLKRDYKSVVSESESISGEVIINVEQLKDTFSEQKRSAYFDLSSVIDKEGKYKSILCTISGNSLRSLWQQHQSKLFNYNIRGFLGENQINKKMKETLAMEPDKFYFYNNGISAICTDLTPELNGHELKAFRCKNFSIINGAQTTTTIGRYKNERHLSEVRILLKITKAEDYKKEKGLNKKIITYNNSQTIIKASDFRSNDDIQIFLENKLPDYSFKGVIPYKKVRYLRKRLKTEKRKENLDVSMESLARALYVFDNEPILIFKGTKYLFDTDSENNGKYWFVFGDAGSEVEMYDTKRLEKTIGIFFLWYKVENKIKSLSKSLKEENKENIKYQALLAKWHILWAYGYVLNTYHKTELETIFRKLATGKIFEATSEVFIERWFSKIHNTVAKCIEKNYKATRKKDGEEMQSFNFKNWLRNNSAFEELVTEFKYMDKSDFPL